MGDSALLPFKGKLSRSPALLDEWATVLNSPIHKTFLWHSHPLFHWHQPPPPPPPFLEMFSGTGVGEESWRSQLFLPLRKKARPKEEEKGEGAGVKKGIEDGKEGGGRKKERLRERKREGKEEGERGRKRENMRMRIAEKLIVKNSKANGVK